MKTFLTSLKGKIIAGASTAAVTVGVIVAAVVLNSGYRTIVVDELNGITNILNNSKLSEAYTGQHLVSGDDVTVTKNSDLTLALDEDKYVFAEEDTHFWIQAKGKLNDTRTEIFMDAGSNLFRIDEKLKEEEEFTVDTPNTTMSVRGTVFRVSLRVDENGDKYTLVEVFEGEVYVEAKYELGDITGENTVLVAGESVIIRSNSNFSEFVKNDDGKVNGEINYPGIPQKTARKLGLAIDQGRKLAITKDLLFDLVSLTDHRFHEGDIVTDASCDEPGVRTEVCEVCGTVVEEEIPQLEHEFYDEEVIPEDNPDDGYILRRCRYCNLIIRTDLHPENHEYDDNWTVIKAPTCTADGIEERKCNTCDNTEQRLVKRLGHKFGNPIVRSDRVIVRKCERCQMEETIGIQPVENNIPSTDGHVTPTPPPSQSSDERHSDGDNQPSKEDDSTPYEDGTPTPPVAPTPPKPTPPAHTHTWVQDTSKNNKPATCAEKGIEYQKCSECGQTQEVEIPVDTSAHNFVQDTSKTNKPATCNEKGIEYQKCSRCGTTNEVETPEDTNAHNFVKDTSKADKPATCNEKGAQYQKCSRCGTPKEVETPIDTSKHNYVSDPTNAANKAATCKDTGVEYQKCSRCGAGKEIEIPKTSTHNYVLDSTRGEAATCKKQGKEYHVCSVCGAEDIKDIPMTSHDYSGSRWSVADTDPTKHERKCGICGEPEMEEHTWSPFTEDPSVGGHSRSCSKCSEYEIHEPSGDEGRECSGHPDCHIIIGPS